MPAESGARYDAIVVGSGFGGTFAAHSLVHAGWRVLMLERGDWVPRGASRTSWTVSWRDRPDFSVDTPYHREGDRRTKMGAFHCVGGRSVVYGGVSFRLREEDLQGDPRVSDGIRWPFGYDALLPWYEAAEELLGVRGGADDDPTDPPRLAPMRPSGTNLSATSRSLWEAADRLGMRPFRLPLAINRSENGRAACTGCGVCDGFACAIGAKNDLATVAIPPLRRRGMELRTNAVAVRIDTRDGRATGVECMDRRDGSRFRVEGDRVVVAAGALGTAHLLLTSGLDRPNPAGHLIGANLMRHCNGVVLGASTRPSGATGEFRKQLGIHDFYFGVPGGRAPAGKLGAIQQVRATRIGLALAPIPEAAKSALLPAADRFVALMVMAEDQPVPSNRLVLDPSKTDRFGRPVARVHHRHTDRDLAARSALSDQAERVLEESGAVFTARIGMKTFSHDLGTARMGSDPQRYPVDPSGRLRGVENVWVTDGSVFPTSGAVNPSLTIAANALRVGRTLVDDRSLPEAEEADMRSAPGPPPGRRPSPTGDSSP